MKNTSSASFSFISHQINKFSYSNPVSDEPGVSVEFHVSGVYNSVEGLYTLTLEFNATYGDDNKVFANIVAEGVYKFTHPIKKDDIPEYFYSNSIAILFPYLRAFVTTLTSVANIKPLVLPTLNLGSLAEPLKENTTWEP